jgi:branched-chain amino acid transport system substrate-binding protein
VNLRWTILLFSALLAGAAGAAPGDKTDVVRDLSGRVGPIVGSALACRDIARPRIQVIVDKFAAIIPQFSSSEAERADLTQLPDRNIADGRIAVTSGQTDCRLAERQLADLKQPIARPALPAAAAPSPATVAPCFAAATAIAPIAAVAVGARVRGITDREIRFGKNSLLDLGLAVSLDFGRAEHQASHEIWATAIDENGKYQAIELE